MEFVDGHPITDTAMQHRLERPRHGSNSSFRSVRPSNTRTRKAIIHRDLKPSNVLIAMYDDKPGPEIIDFGVAKAAPNRSLHGRHAFTPSSEHSRHLRIHEPRAGEAEPRDIDMRSDVYALGVLLYELFTGTPPLTGLSLRANRYSQVVEQIRRRGFRPPDNARPPPAPRMLHVVVAIRPNSRVNCEANAIGLP